jgi:hypothetical protein
MRKMQLTGIALVLTFVSGMTSAETLVSNLAQPASGGYECYCSQWFASPFVTDAQEWYIVSVTLRLKPVEMPHNNPFVWIFADNGSGHPSGTRVASFNNPELPIGIEANYTFTASTPIQLAANTRYYVAVGTDNCVSMQRIRWYNTTSPTYAGIGVKPFLAYIDTGRDFDWDYTRDYYTMMFQVEVEPSTIPTEHSSWGAIKSLYGD